MEVEGKRFMDRLEGLKQENGFVHLHIKAQCIKINHLVRSYRGTAVMAAAVVAVVAQSA